MTRLITPHKPDPRRAVMLRTVRQLRDGEYCGFRGSKFALIRVGRHLRPFGEKLKTALELAGVKP